MMKTGLILGKFAPFHLGHQFLIDTALNEVDKLYVLVYETDQTNIPLPIRADWIRALYPEATVLEGWGSPSSFGPDRAMESANEDFVLKMLAGQRVTHFYSCEFYGEYISQALGARDRRLSGRDIPVSGEIIGQDPFLHRSYIDPLVYRDLITKVTLVGATATGKTSLAEALAREFKTVWVPEYGKHYLQTSPIGRRLGSRDFDSLILKQMEIEEEFALSANRYLFVDTCALMTYMYSMDFLGRTSELVSNAAKENTWQYDLFFLCDLDFTQPEDPEYNYKRELFQKRILADLLSRNIPFIVLRGSLTERIQKVKKVLADFQKYQNYFGSIVGS
jgi:NadR type nicotinamide-nucleotide adenylyltransferase